MHRCNFDTMCFVTSNISDLYSSVGSLPGFPLYGAETNECNALTLLNSKPYLAGLFGLNCFERHLLSHGI